MGEAFHFTLHFHKAFQAAVLTCLSEAGGGLLPESYPVVCSHPPLPAPGLHLHSQVAGCWCARLPECGDQCEDKEGETAHHLVLSYIHMEKEKEKEKKEEEEKGKRTLIGTDMS